MNIEDITLGEIAEIEEYANLPISDIASDKTGATSLKIALATIIKRRQNPKFTFEDGAKLTTKDLDNLFEDDDEKKE